MGVTKAAHLVGYLCERRGITDGNGWVVKLKRVHDFYVFYVTTKCYSHMVSFNWLHNSKCCLFSSYNSVLSNEL